MTRPAQRTAARAIVVHGLADARAALAAAREAGSPVALWSAPDAGCYGGAAWFAELTAQAAAAEPGATFETALDCGDDAGVAAEALRHGLRRVRFSGAVATRRKLEQIAGALGAAVVADRPDALDPQHEPDPAAAMRAWLQTP